MLLIGREIYMDFVSTSPQQFGQELCDETRVLLEPVGYECHCIYVPADLR